jgi:hypothetical protein
VTGELLGLAEYGLVEHQGVCHASTTGVRQGLRKDQGRAGQIRGGFHDDVLVVEEQLHERHGIRQTPGGGARGCGCCVRLFGAVPRHHLPGKRRSDLGAGSVVVRQPVVVDGLGRPDHASGRQFGPLLV